MNDAARSGLIVPDSKSMEHRSFLLPRNHRTMPLNRPTEFRSELDVESDSSARSLCLGVRVGRMVPPFRRRFPNGDWLTRHVSSSPSVSRRL